MITATKSPVAWMAALLSVAAFSMPAFADGEPEEQVTYAKHISRILQENCEECHHPGGIGPFSFTTYRQARGWSRMINEVVSERRMPPWHADPHVNEFKNDRRLTDEEVAMIGNWVENGMPRGNPEDMPERREYDTDVKWRIGGGEPDKVWELPEEVNIKATGVMPYLQFVVPSGFEEDTWIQEMEAIPGNSKVVHHILMYVITPEDRRRANDDVDEFLRLGNGFLTGFAPGTVANIAPEGLGYKIPAGSSILFQMHYTPTGKEEVDRSKFGVVFSETKPKFEIQTATTVNFDFKIPAHADNHRVVADAVMPKDGVIFSMTPHMHYRGKSFDYYAKFPDGTERHLLSVPFFDFNWQTTYSLAEPEYLPEGTVIHTVAHFDNSADNPYNPDPEKPVTWGDQTWEEMMIGWMSMAFVDSEEEIQEVKEAYMNDDRYKKAYGETYGDD